MTEFTWNEQPNLVPDVHMCCGCGACSAVCPSDAIDLFKDDKGFLFPRVDFDRCVKCLLCEKVCAFKIDSLVQ